MMKDYKVSLQSLLFYYLMAAVMSVFAIWLIFSVVLNPSRNGRWFAGLWACFVLLYALPQALRLPHTVSWDESGQLVFRSLLTRRVFQVRDLVSIETSFGNFLYFKFREDKTATLRHIEDLSELIWTIKSANPGIKTKGC